LNSTSEGPWRNEDDSDKDGDEDSARINFYRLPTTNITLQVLHLQTQPFPATDGIWSPVGAAAWYSSALLATILLVEDDETGSIFPKHCSRPVILELGSGAVPLSGSACAIALGRHFEQATVLLADNNPPVLD
jgi:hypothetical protein